MPIPLIIAAAVLLLIALLLSLRVNLTLICREAVTLDLRVLFVRRRLYPPDRKAGKRSRKKRSGDDEKAAAEEKHRKEHEEEKAPLTFAEKIRRARALAAVLIRCTHKHLRLNAKRLHIRVATGDAATTAIAYGATSQSLAYLLAGLDKVTHLRAVKPDVRVEADFLGERPSADIKLVFSISVWGALCSLSRLGAAYFKAKREAARRAKTEKKKEPDPGPVEQVKNSDQIKKGN